MPVTLIAEDGSGVSGANSYVSLVDANAYFNLRLHNAVWDASADDDKSRALISATRALDQEVLARYGGWAGTRVKLAQSLGWPRAWVPDPDPINPALDPTFVLSLTAAQYLPDNAIPVLLIDATCDTALALLVADRALDPPGQGITDIKVGSIAVAFDHSGRDQIEPVPKDVSIRLGVLTVWGDTTVSRIVRA
jgi:hypothetical protein